MLCEQYLVTLFEAEDKDSTILQNVRNYSLSDTNTLIVSLETYLLPAHDVFNV